MLIYFLIIYHSQKTKKIDLQLVFLRVRYDKGFYKTELIRILNNKVPNKINFIIQINNCPSNLIKTKNFELAREFNNIKLINGYINFFEYREILKTIDIIPLLHELDQLKNCGSGIVFSSMVNEIPMVIPKNAIFVSSFFKYESFLEANDITDYSQSIEKLLKIIQNFLKRQKNNPNYI